MKFLSDILVKAGLVVENTFSANAATNTIYAGTGTRLRTEANNLVFERVSSSGTMKMVFAQGTLSPTAKAYIGYSNATLNLILANEYATAGLELRTSDIIRQQIFANGNIVIGQASPVDAGFKVDITGTARVTGIFTGSDIRTGSHAFRDQMYITATADGHTRQSAYNASGAYTLGFVGDLRFASVSTVKAVFSFNGAYSNNGTIYGGEMSLMKIFTGDAFGQSSPAVPGTNQYGINLMPTLNYTSSTSIFTGFYYNPTLVATTGLTHYAMHLVNGLVRVGDLSGTGTRMVVADGSGVLSTQAIPSLSGYVPTSRILTINGTSYDLSADRSWTIATGVSSLSSGTGISVSTVSGVATVTNTGLLSAASGTGISVSTSNQQITVTNTGLLSAASGTGISVTTSNQQITVTNLGLLSAISGTGISASTVNQQLTITNLGLLSAVSGTGISVTTTNQQITVTNTGILSIISGTGISASTVNGATTITNLITNTNQLTNGAGYITSSALSGYATQSYVTSQGYITGITSGMVTGALGYTPVQPNGTGASGTWGINISGTAQYFANNYIGQADANTIWRAGSYTFFNGVNVPGGDFGLISFPTWSSTDSNSRYNIQLGANIGGNLRYRSTNINGAASWATMLSDANYTSYSPTLTGGGASGTWGISITGNADTVDGYHASTSTIGNYIVVRDGNGYIFGNYVNMTDDGNPGGGTAITSFITKQGDNYYRSVSPTNAMVSIRGVASGSWAINITGNASSSTTTTHLSARTDGSWYNVIWGAGSPSYLYSADSVQIRSSDGALRANIFYDNQDTSYYVDPNSNSYLSRLRVADASSGVSLHVGLGSTHGVYTLDNDRKYLVVSGEYYPHMALVARSANNINHGAVFSFVGSEGGAFRQWNLGISNNDPFLFSIGYNRTNDPNPHYGVGDGWSSSDFNHARLSVDRDGNTKIRGMLYVNGTSGGISTGSAVIHAGNIGSQSVNYASSAGSASSAARAFYSIDGFYNQGGHGSSWIQNELPAANNGASTGRVVLRMWCSEPNATWDWAGFGYNVLNDGGSPAAFGRFNTNFGQAYMRFATDGNWYFYNTNVSGTRTQTMQLTPSSNVIVGGGIGIGGVTPDVRLSVNGDAHVSNIMYMGGTAGTVNSWGTRTYGNSGDWTTNAKTVRFDNVGYGSSWAFTIDASGNAQSSASMRAPIFYDSNDTSYYVDPNSLSRIYRLQVIGDWAGGNPNEGAINIRGAYPSMTFRNTVSGNMWLRHMDGSGDIQHYFAPSGVDATNWSIKHTMFTNGNFYSSGSHTASQFNGSGAGLTGTASSLSVNYANSAGSVAWGNVSGRPTGVSSFTNDSGYITSGSNVVGLYSSGFGNGNFTWYQSPGGLAPYTGSWASFLVSNHGDGATYYNQTIIMPFWGPPQYSRKEGGPQRGPYTFWTTENLDPNNISGNFYASGSITAGGDVTAYSDARVKTNIVTIENPLQKALALRGVTYTRTDSDDKKTKMGVIAQEVLEVVPEVINQDNDGIYSVAYGNMVGLLIEAMKEQQQQIEDLKSKLDAVTK